MFSHHRMTPTRILAVVLGLAALAWAGPAAPATLSGPPTWGNPNQPWGTRRPVTPADRAAIAAFRAPTRPVVYATVFTDADALKTHWWVQSDDQPYLKSCRGPESVAATGAGLVLATRMATHCRAAWETGAIGSRFRQPYGLYEASLKAADVSGINNAFWLTTTDNFEIDIAEVHFPGIVRMTLHNHNVAAGQPGSVGFNAVFADDFSKAFHDYGVLWTPTDLIFEVDGEPVAAIATANALRGTADNRFSTAVMDYAGAIPAHPEGHNMVVRSLRFIAM
jgi:hypothetical protein